jgi:dTDP-4-amino-4,6-dideoxygalactose transaminase
MRETFLPFSLPQIEKEECEEVVETLKSGWITTGPRAQRFEDEFKNYVGSKHAIAVNSCTAGLHLSLAALGVKAEDEVITSPFTFCSTAHAIVHLNAAPVFADIQAETRNVDPSEIRKRITPKTKALLIVHYAGQPCEMDEIEQIAAEFDLKIVEDAAHAVAAEYRGKRVGSLGHVASFSFYATKNLTTGEGGMVTTNDEELAEQIRLLSLHGISRDAWKRYEKGGSWYYEVLEAGYKYNMSDIQAALGLHQLAKLERFQRIREDYVHRYNQAFAEVPEIEIPVARSHVRHAWHLYTILLRPERLVIDRSQFIELLHERNIGTSVHFIPLHLQPFYRDNFGLKQGDFPKAEYVYERIISLPLYPKMTEDDVIDVIDAVKDIVEHCRKY